MTNSRGQVVGVNSWRPEMTPSGRRIEGIGYAISSNEVLQLLPLLKGGLIADCKLFEVEALGSQELPVILKAGARIWYEFVLYEQEGQGLNVTFSILDPSGNPVALYERVERGEGSVVARNAGIYTLVLDNSFSIFTTKWITLFYVVEPSGFSS